MERNKLVCKEILCVILLILNAVMMIYMPVKIIKDSGKTILLLNNKNRDVIAEYMDKAGKTNINLENANKIQYYLNFNDDEYTIYYKDGTKNEIYADELSSLSEYINKEGCPKIVIDLFFILALIICYVFLYERKTDISLKIDFIDMQRMKK